MKTIGFIGRKQNSHWLKPLRDQFQGGMERERLREMAGLQNAKLSVSELSDADIVMIRLNPERVNRATLKRVQKAQEKCASSAVILNSAQHFHRYAEKSQCFKTWQENGLATPEYRVLDLRQSTHSLAANIAEQLKTIKLLYVRTSNEDSGKGIFTLTDRASQDDIQKTIKSLKKRAVLNKVSESKLLCVAAVNNIDENGVAHIYRAHVCCGKLLGGYALVGTDTVIHAKDLRLKDWSEFVTHNERLSTLLTTPEHQQTILRAARVLGSDIGAVEFFYIDNQLVFLELNPMWGGIHKLGDEPFMNQLQSTQNQPELANVKHWIHPETFYTQMYTQIATHYTSVTNNP